MFACRFRSLDSLRGLAILLMCFDHFVLVFSLPVLFRVPGRLSMPLFMVVSGFLWQGHHKQRLFRVTLAALLALPFEFYLGIPFPGILFVWLLCQVFMPYAYNYPWHVLFASLIFYLTPHFWLGYHPGMVLSFLTLGVLMDQRLVENIKLPVFFEFFGKYPLSFFVGHLFILWGLKYAGA